MTWLRQQKPTHQVRRHVSDLPQPRPILAGLRWPCGDDLHLTVPYDWRSRTLNTPASTHWRNLPKPTRIRSRKKSLSTVCLICGVQQSTPYHAKHPWMIARSEPTFASRLHGPAILLAACSIVGPIMGLNHGWMCLSG